MFLVLTKFLTFSFYNLALIFPSLSARAPCASAVSLIAVSLSAVNQGLSNCGTSQRWRLAILLMKTMKAVVVPHLKKKKEKTTNSGISQSLKIKKCSNPITVQPPPCCSATLAASHPWLSFPRRFLTRKSRIRLRLTCCHLELIRLSGCGR